MADHAELEISAGQEPQNVREFNERGWIYLTQGKYGLAESDFRQAIVKNSRFADAFFGLGLTLKCQGKLAEARNAFEKTVSYLGKEATNDDRVRVTMLRRLAEDHLKIIGGIPE